MFSLMWSEHCAYKHSKKLLRKLPVEGPHLLMGPGENAGAVDVGDGLAIAFKVESHNHPSAVEPFQGAATGVGGILRDVFAVGARPIAVLDSLRFGELDSQRSRYLLDGAVSGIGHYGNSIGVPTVGGEVYFEGPYEQNCLVNAMCARDRAARAADPRAPPRASATSSCCSARAPGATGSAARRCWRAPSCRVRRRVEAAERCRSATRSRRRSCWSAASSCSTAARSRRCRTSAPPGCRRARPRWRRRARSGSTSTSSQRAAARGRTWSRSRSWSRSRRSGCSAWSSRRSSPSSRRSARAGRCARPTSASSPTRAGCACSTATRSSATCRSRRSWTTARSTTSSRPSPPRRSTRTRRARAGRRPAPRRPCSRCSARANIASQALRVPAVRPDRQSRTVRRPAEADAAVLLLEHDGGGGAIAISIDGNGRRVACDPYTGTVEAVLECARNLACVGAEPLGLTNCLNFGNPEKPHIAWQLDAGGRRAADALPRARRAGRRRQRLALQRVAARGRSTRRRSSAWSASCPMPRACRRLGFARRGRRRGDVRHVRDPRLEGSELAKLRGRAAPDGLPAIDLDRPGGALGGDARRRARRRAASRAHDVAEGGFARRAGRGVHRRRDRRDADTLGDGADPVETCAPVRRGRRRRSSSPARARRSRPSSGRRRIFGEVGGDALEIAGALSVPVAELERVFEGTIPAAFAG